jgi:hypothetical protein
MKNGTATFTHVERSRWAVFAALALAATIGYLDLNASEVQGSVLLVLLCSGAFSFAQPKRWWAWFLLFGAAVPIAHVLQQVLGISPKYPVHPNIWATYIAFVPAAIGVAGGAGARLASTQTN